MAKVFTGFKGIAPLVSELLLAPGKGTIARNFLARGGAMEPLRQPVPLLDTGRAGVRGLYRFGLSLPDEDKYWFTFDKPVNVVPGPIADNTERTYITGLDVPRVTDFALATGNGGASTKQLPVATYPLAVPTPIAPQALPGAGGSGDIETRFYVRTVVTPWGEESAPSPPSNVVELKQGQPVEVKLPALPSGARPIKAQRLYRSATTSSGTRALLLVVELPVEQGSYTDQKLGTQLAEKLETAGFAPPPDDLRGLVALPGGVLAGFSGKEICFSEPWLPYAWPEKYRLTMNLQPIGLGVIEGGLAVLTTGKPVMIAGSEPDSMSPAAADFDQACLSASSIVSNGSGVIYASPDGLCYLGAGGSRVLTADTLNARQWQAYAPKTLRGYLFEGQYIGFYDGGGFIFDLSTGDFIPLSSTFPAGFVDEQRDSVYVAQADGKVLRFNSGDYMAATWRSAPLQRTMSPALAKVIASRYPVTLRLFDGDVLVGEATATSRAAFRFLPVQRRRDVFKIEVEAAGPVQAVGLADSFQDPELMLL
ncbi:hypothetical protein AA0N74_07805 [Chromobacterium vaccinii]|uniref:hypothetical protein n=1 Tax=Chromobacterium vaccinii TaxID=1108595 RepID=UPI0031D96472